MFSILVVDDDVDTCLHMADRFGERGYAIEMAECGTTALAKAGRQPYDLDLLDLRMPGMDGVILCEHLRRLQPRMVATLVTAYGDRDVDQKARAAGARHLLLRPVDVPRLLDLVEQVLAGA